MIRVRSLSVFFLAIGYSLPISCCTRFLWRPITRTASRSLVSCSSLFLVRGISREMSRTAGTASTAARPSMNDGISLTICWTGFTSSGAAGASGIGSCLTGSVEDAGSDQVTPLPCPFFTTTPWRSSARSTETIPRALRLTAAASDTVVIATLSRSCWRMTSGSTSSGSSPFRREVRLT